MKVREKDQIPWIERFGNLDAETGLPLHLYVGTTNQAPGK